MKHDLPTITQTYLDWRNISQSLKNMNAGVKGGCERGKKKKKNFIHEVANNLIPVTVTQTEKFNLYCDLWWNITKYLFVLFL